MKEYYGVYRGKDGSWAWRLAEYADDIIALTGMRVLSLKKLILDDEGKQKEKLVFYDLDYLVCGNRVVFNG